MKFSKKEAGLTTGLLAGSLALSLLFVSATTQEGRTNIIAEGTATDYSMSFDSTTNSFGTATTESTHIAKTDLGNDVSFTFNNLGQSTNCWALLNEGGYFYNTTPISGLKSISISFLNGNGVKVSYGWSPSLYQGIDISIDSFGTSGGIVSYDFNGEMPSYFKISYASGAAKLNSITLKYSCVASNDPYSKPGFAYTLDSGGASYTLSGYSGSDSNVVIPMYHEGLPIKAIGSNAFLGSTIVTKVTIPSFVTNIGASAFQGCQSLSEVAFAANSSLTTISTLAFQSTGLTHFVVPSKVTTIGTDAFGLCRALTSFSIPAATINLGATMLRGDTAMSAITIDSENSNFVTDGKAIYDHTMATLVLYANNGTSYDIPSSVNSINNDAFIAYSNLKTITIPASVVVIGSHAFGGCLGLTSLTIASGSKLKIIAGSAFHRCSSLTSFNLPASVTTMGSDFSGCVSLSSLTVDAANTAYSADGRALYNKDKTTLLAYGSSGTSFEVPSTVTTISSHAFGEFTTLSSLSIPASVTSIANNALYGCTGLSNLGIAAGNPNYTSDGKALFNKDESTLMEYVNSGSSYEVPSTVTKLDAFAFCNCSNLLSLVLPASLTSVASPVAFDLMSDSAVIYFKGTDAQWTALNAATKAMKISYYSASDMSSATDHSYWYYLSGVPTLWNPSI
jgi:hypothetical protein